MPIRLWRCLRLVNILQSSVGYSVSHLACEFEVSKRTIYRDFRFLEQAGISISYDPHKGGCVLDQHFNLCVSKLSVDELKALLLASHIFSLSCAREVSHPLQRAIGKLLAQLPHSSRENLSTLLSSIRGRPFVSLWPKGSQVIIAEILLAISNKQPVRIVYKPSEESAPIRTKVTPKSLTNREGRWYLVGRSTWHRKVCSFDIEQIQAAEQIAEIQDPWQTFPIFKEQQNRTDLNPRFSVKKGA